MKAVWHMWPGWLSDAACDSIIEHAEKIPGHDGYVGLGADARIDHRVRECFVRSIARRNEDFKQLWDEIEERFEIANRDWFGLDIRHTTNLQFTTYTNNRLGHYDWHQDIFLGHDGVYDRKLSLVLQLSCPKTYEGGDLELDTFKRPDPEALRLRGTVIVFPSMVHHRVTNVTRGKRHSLVAWKEGLPWR